MRVTNDPDEGSRGTSAFSELLRLQTDFQARLAEETLRYLRRLQGTVAPAAPGTIVLPEEGLVLRAEARPGGRARLRVEIENLQRVHCMVSPQLTPLVGRSGATWFPAVEPAQPSLLVAPGATELLILEVMVPRELPPDLYTGAVLLQGFRHGALAVSIDVADPEAASARAASARRQGQPASASAAAESASPAEPVDPVVAPKSTAETAGMPTADTRAAKNGGKKGAKSSGRSTKNTGGKDVKSAEGTAAPKAGRPRKPASS